MFVFRSTFNGIGSGAGLAWPTFGIVFNLIGGVIGSLVSLVLAIPCLVLFTGVALAILYFSYKRMKDEQVQFFDKYKKNQTKLAGVVQDYLDSLSNSNPKDDLAKDTHIAYHQGTHSPLYQILQISRC
ncbi:MAG: hypothetical protein H0U75_03450 [Legionella sp.]|nr:hypothetical protein [Legionella sp.]